MRTNINDYFYCMRVSIAYRALQDFIGDMYIFNVCSDYLKGIFSTITSIITEVIFFLCWFLHSAGDLWLLGSYFIIIIVQFLCYPVLAHYAGSYFPYYNILRSPQVRIFQIINKIVNLLPLALFLSDPMNGTKIIWCLSYNCLTHLKSVCPKSPIT
jgi:hypothetical protein